MIRPDRLYSPPYLFDETDAEYDKFLVNGPVKPLADIEHGMDGTIKHFVSFANSRERVCDYIQDRYGNTTNLVYPQTTVTSVTDSLNYSVSHTYAVPSVNQRYHLGANDYRDGQWRQRCLDGQHQHHLWFCAVCSDNCQYVGKRL